MKRSSKLSLTMMSVAPMMLVACAEHQPPKKIDAPATPTAYESVEACEFDGIDRKACQTAFDNAKKEAIANAPRFSSGDDCKLEFADCVEVPTAATAQATSSSAAPAAAPAQQQAGGGSFMPMMMGFMLANSLNSGSSYAAGHAAGFNSASGERERNTSGGGGASSAALYRSRGGDLTTASRIGNGTIAKAPVTSRSVTNENVRVAKQNAANSAKIRQQARAQARSSSRGGFSGSRGGGSFGG